jgi:hypothetical protein
MPALAPALARSMHQDRRHEIVHLRQLRPSSILRKYSL